MTARKRLGERLLGGGAITEAQLADALRAQQVTGEELGSTLMRLGYVSEAPGGAEQSRSTSAP